MGGQVRNLANLQPMKQEYITIKNARVNNLRNVSLQIPKRQITIFTGVSGSGKSSIVFDTISAEAQRQLNETFTMFIRSFLPKFEEPDADAIENLSTAIVIDQKRLGGNSRSTMGTITDIFSLLRLLFSRTGKPHAGYSFAFSFNDPSGMCPECEGIGKKVTVDIDKLFDKSRSLNEGGILFPVFAAGTWYHKSFTYSGLFDNDKKLGDYPEEEWNHLLYGKANTQITYPGDINSTYEGVVEKIIRLYVKKDISDRTRKVVQPFLTMSTCPLCNGARLNQAALNSRIGGYNIAECAAMEVEELIKVIAEIDDGVEGMMKAAITLRLQHLIDIGLGYLSLDRETSTLSGGESQRIKMVRHLSSSLTDLMYVFDEPSIGLHPRDVHRLNELLQKLRDKGNTVLVVEHDRDVIAIADHIVDVGPHAGTKGGEIVYEGSLDGLLASSTLTGRFMKTEMPVKTNFRTPAGYLTIKDAKLHNLQGVTVNIPKGVLTVVTGVAGSGKSTLINRVFLQQFPESISIDQSAVHTTSRSNPATYMGFMDEIRKLFAKANNVNVALFSFNSAGACPGCEGAGVVYTDLAFLEPVRTTCELCGGKRFKSEILNYYYKGKNIAEVLDMTMWEAARFFSDKKIQPILRALNDVGLDYLTLGQPLSTLSGGECQRIKLAGELHKKGSVYVMDEPTTGLHMSDLQHLLDIMNRLVDSGNTVIVIEHNRDIIRNADWIIDLGPEGGHKGGRIVFEGTPAEIVNAPESLTGQYL